MYYNIIPIAKLKLETNSFIYQSATPLSVGDLVLIQLGKVKYLGVVSSEAEVKEIHFTIKQIIRHLSGLYLSAEQLSIVYLVAKKLHLSPSSALQILMPKLLTKKMATKDNKLNTQYFLLPNRKATEFFVKYNSYNDKLKYYEQLIAKTTGQCLIVVPDNISAENIKNYLQKKYNNKKIITLNSTVKASTQTDHWCAIQQNKVKIIIGTRKTIFFPYADLQTIIVDQAANLNHRQWDQNPRFDNNELLKIINKIYKCNLYFVDCFFHLDQYRLIQEQKKYLQIGTNNYKNVHFYKDNQTTAIEKIISNYVINDNLIVLFNHLSNRENKCPECNYQFNGEKLTHCPKCANTISNKVLLTEQWRNILTQKYGSKSIIEFSANSKGINIHNKIIFATTAILPYLANISWSKVIIADIDSWQYYLDLHLQFSMHHLILYLTSFQKPVEIIGSDNFIPLLSDNEQNKFVKQQLLIAKKNNLYPFQNVLRIIFRSKSTKGLITKMTKYVQEHPDLQNNIDCFQQTIKKEHNSYYCSLILTNSEQYDINKFIQSSMKDIYFEFNPFHFLNS